MDSSVIDMAPKQPLPSAKLHSITQIVDALAETLEEGFVKQRKQGGIEIDYIEWFTAVQFLDAKAPGWSGEVTRVDMIGDYIVITYKISIPTKEGIISREATGNEMIKGFKGYGDPFSNAEAMAFKRAAAKFELALYLYEKD